MVLSVASVVPETEPEHFFQKLDSGVQSELFFQGEISKHERGQLVMPKGEVSGELHILIDGMVKVTCCEHSKHLTLALLRPGDMFGELSMISEQPASADIVAIEDSTILSIKRSKVYALLQDSTPFMCLFLETMAQRTRHVVENICAIALEDVYGRLKRTLTILTQENGEDRKITGITHADLADMVGSSREMVSIIMKELKLGDYLRVDGRTITLLKALPEKR